MCIWGLFSSSPCLLFTNFFRTSSASRYYAHKGRVSTGWHLVNFHKPSLTHCLSLKMVGKWDESSICPWYRDEIRGDPAVWAFTVGFGVHVFNFACAHTHTFILFPTLKCCFGQNMWLQHLEATPALGMGASHETRAPSPWWGAGLLQEMPRARVGIFSCREKVIRTLNKPLQPLHSQTLVG